jgi:tetratricopeptide (TPR) repeat protein
MTDRARNLLIWTAHSQVDGLLWDIGAQLHDNQEAIKLPDYNGGAAGSLTQIPVDYIMLHDTARADEAAKAMRASPLAPQKTLFDFAIFQMDYFRRSWSQVLMLAQQVQADIDQDQKNHVFGASGEKIILVRDVFPLAAQAYAEVGDFKRAHEFADRTPLDCYTCLWVRGTVDALQHNPGGADYWFARAVKAAPSIPIGYFEWGTTLLARGDLEGAIAKLEIAHQKGPHFADPLELWGEVLIAQNRSDLALAKFAEANKYAPRWGRLHLKWGEALWWSGKRGEAKKQFALAAGLDLTSSEKSECVRMTSL